MKSVHMLKAEHGVAATALSPALLAEAQAEAVAELRRMIEILPEGDEKEAALAQLAIEEGTAVKLMKEAALAAAIAAGLNALSAIPAGPEKNLAIVSMTVMENVKYMTNDDVNVVVNKWLGSELNESNMPSPRSIQKRRDAEKAEEEANAEKMRQAQEELMKIEAEKLMARFIAEIDSVKSELTQAEAEVMHHKETIEVEKADLEMKNNLLSALEVSIVNQTLQRDHEREEWKAMQRLCAKLLRTYRGQIRDRIMSAYISCWHHKTNKAYSEGFYRKIERLQKNIRQQTQEKITIEKTLQALMDGTWKDDGSGIQEEEASLPALTAVSVLDMTLALRMGPTLVSRSGIVINNMKALGYSDDDCNVICRGLFLDHDEEDMRAAWKLFADEGSINTFEFKEIVPLLGGKASVFLSDEKVDELFALADADGSGEIDYDEFVVLIKGLNTNDTGSLFSSFGDFGL